MSICYRATPDASNVWRLSHASVIESFLRNDIEKSQATRPVVPNSATVTSSLKMKWNVEVWFLSQTL